MITLWLASICIQCVICWEHILFVYLFISGCLISLFCILNVSCHFSYICLVCDFSLMFADSQQRAAADCIYDCSLLSNKAESA